MRYMIIRKADADTEALRMPSEELLTAMTRYNEEMFNAGILISGDGLRPSAEGFRVKFSGGKPMVTDGPFAEVKELIAGYTIIQVASKEEALEWVKRWPVEDAGGEVSLEIRPFFEAEDFGKEFTPEARATEERMRAELAAR